MKVFGYKFFEKEIEENNTEAEDNLLLERAKTVKLKYDLADKENEILRSNKEPIYINVHLEDPAPDDTEARKMYVAKIAGLHTEILKSKLEHMISESANCLKNWENDKDMDMKLKGVIYALEEVIRWGDMMVNEQVANQIEGQEEK